MGMKELKKSRHAEIRQQQRCISDLQVSTLFTFGTKKRLNGSTFIYFIKEDLLNQLIAYLKSRMNHNNSRKMFYNMSKKIIKKMNSFLVELSAKWSSTYLTVLLDSLSRLSDTRLIVADGTTVVTVMHGYRKIKATH